MYNFKIDYSEGAHPNILQKLIQTNFVQQMGYGEDEYSLKAKDILRTKMNQSDAAIHFVSGGTQSNLIVIAALLRPHEAVISATTGHIYAKETGAIEATGHRIITVETNNGKINREDIQVVLAQHSQRPHVVRPKMVYISNSTEIGTIYSKAELIEIYEFCQTNNLYLFLDGARLGHALTAENNDLTLADIAALTDVFYIGGTKNGALIGEAVVFSNLSLEKDFDYMLKQRGGLLAKGRLMGIQFLELFKDDLYFSLAKHANTMAMKIAHSIQEQGFTFLTESTTNQIFPIFPKTIIEALSEKYFFYVWQEIDEEHAAIRLITSWATDETKVDEFIHDMKQIHSMSCNHEMLIEY